MVASAVKLPPFHGPPRRAILSRVLLSRRDQYLETICLLFTKLEAHLFLGHLEGLADSDPREQLSVERLREADCHRVQYCLALLAADDVRHVALLEYLAHELRHAGSHKHDFDFGRGLLEDLAELTLTDQLTIAILRFKQQVAHVFLPHQTHACVRLVKAVTGDVQTAGSLLDHLNELVLRCD